ncbi:hypothetical protein GCK32_019963 [Trichostrongylus colubriformis]|uniref:Uncharacterized protein n=1 Tax=Trichostrongylus colubriformis TaxID=6319 RepID=A0AAN8FEJ4_TRICO
MELGSVSFFLFFIGLVGILTLSPTLIWIFLLSDILLKFFVIASTYFMVDIFVKRREGAHNLYWSTYKTSFRSSEMWYAVLITGFLAVLLCLVCDVILHIGLWQFLHSTKEVNCT